MLEQTVVLGWERDHGVGKVEEVEEIGRERKLEPPEDVEDGKVGE